ncbi:unnamed protein product (mitochondrion) [Plasmodiophora brassicae]|uniref:RING-type E3 ubiquitin transferase n=1 Tax=Plasmodiophora brassicae TaxID=37360 RepID=A0A0G4II38_PLABS|nr:hypothetical protein PBRA_000521 [Plasmodiophora brassicae]SPQ93006.1 unnamed protein product [Plasmodiophora brassicae]
MRLQEMPWQELGVFGLLVQFITERDLDVDDACQWVRTNLAESTTTQIQLLLSAADNLEIRLFIIAIGITLPLPTTRMPALPSVGDLRESSVIGPSTVLADEVDHDDNECVICHESTGQVMTFRYLWCGHRFHVDCIDRWLIGSNLCPMCRVEGITPWDAVQVTIAQREFDIPKTLAADVVRIWNEQA